MNVQYDTPHIVEKMPNRWAMGDGYIYVPDEVLEAIVRRVLAEIAKVQP